MKDPAYTVKTTINGQLVLTMLAEKLGEIGEFIMLNTDGMELIIPEDREQDYFDICNEWEKLTGVELEHDEYECMWIKDVNNYIAKSTKGKVKRKGMFMIYEDYIGNWSKNPSGLIIPEAINAYFLEGKDPSDTITNWNNIHDFLFGLKGGNSFSYIVFDIENRAITKMKENTDRAIRYYCSKEGGALIKWWKKGKKAEVGIPFESASGTKGQSVKLLQHVRDRKGQIFRMVKQGDIKVLQNKYEDIDYDYYISEAWKWIHVIENQEEDVEFEIEGYIDEEE